MSITGQLRTALRVTPNRPILLSMVMFKESKIPSTREHPEKFAGITLTCQDFVTPLIPAALSVAPKLANITNATS